MKHNLITNVIAAPISIGELLDKITILQIKKDNIKDEIKLKSINNELSLLEEISENIPHNELFDNLKETNKKLWIIEDRIREKERLKEFDEEFIELARSVYFTNDKRCDIKKEINMLYNSIIVEEKSYEKY